MTRNVDTPLPLADQLVNELLKLLPNRGATLHLARGMSGLMSLRILGGPLPPTTEQEVARRVQRLWALLREYMDGQLERELANDAIVQGETTAKACVEAARLIFRADKRGDTWRLSEADDLRKLEVLRDKADGLLRPSSGWRANRKSFERNFQRPILAGLARLLLRAEEDQRAADAAPDASERVVENPPEPDEVSVPSPRWRRARWRLGAAGLLTAWLAALAVMVAARGSEDDRVGTVAAGDLGVTLSIRSSGLPSAPGQDVTAAVALADNAADLRLRAEVRSQPDVEGAIPANLHLVVDVPQVSTTSTVLPSAHLARGRDPVSETGRRTSDAATIIARDSRRIALDVPTHPLINTRDTGNVRRRPLPSRFVGCTERSCTVRVPIARYVSQITDADILRLEFGVMAFAPRRKDGPLLLIDMEQRRLDGPVLTDGEIRASPGERIVYSFYVTNRGNRPARRMVARVALGDHLRLQPGSARASTASAAAPFAVDDNLTSGGLRYPMFRPGASARFSLIAHVTQSARQAGEVYPHLLVRSANTGGSTYLDSVATRIVAGPEH